MKTAILILFLSLSLSSLSQPRLYIDDQAVEFAGVTKNMFGLIEALETHDFEKAVTFFDTAHFNPQIKMYSEDVFMFSHLGKVGERDRLAILRLYLMESMQIRLKSADQMEEIKKVKVARVSVEDNSHYITFKIKVKGAGNQKAKVYFDNKTFSFSGPYG